MISVRVSESTMAAVDAARGGTSRSSWVQGLIYAELENSGEDHEVRHAEETGFAEAMHVAKCAHPRARVIKGFCYRCGTMVNT